MPEDKPLSKNDLKRILAGFKEYAKFHRGQAQQPWLALAEEEYQARMKLADRFDKEFVRGKRTVQES